MVIVTRLKDKIVKTVLFPKRESRCSGREDGILFPKRESSCSSSEDGIEGLKFTGNMVKVVKAHRVNVRKIVKMNSIANVNSSEQYDNSECCDEDETTESSNDNFCDKMDRCFVIVNLYDVKSVKVGDQSKDVFNLLAVHPDGRTRIMSVWGVNATPVHSFFM